MAVVTLTFIDEHDRHFEHATPFNLPTKVQPTSLSAHQALQYLRAGFMSQRLRWGT
jgi:hypothetical protein